MKNKKWDKRQLENSAFDKWWQKDTTEVNKVFTGLEEDEQRRKKQSRPCICRLSNYPMESAIGKEAG